MDYDDKMFTAMVAVKRHLGSCKACQIAKKTRLPDDMCQGGLRAMLTVATLLDDLIRIRVIIHKSGTPYVYPCPDPQKHGKAHAMSVLPVAVTGIQDRLF